MIINKNQIGATETYDPSYNYSWVDNLRPVNIIITKNLSDKMIDTLLTDECKSTCILHLTVTRLKEVDSRLEPNVPDSLWSKRQLEKLISKGFDPSHVVLRVDPILPTCKGAEELINVLQIFYDSKIRRVRVSILDMYQHVLLRFRKAGITPPYESFQAPVESIKKIDDVLKLFSTRYDFESCAEPHLSVPTKIGCVSSKDLALFPDSGVTLVRSSRQRSECLCPSNKVNIIKGKPSRCPNQCLYCYWKVG